jgi:hypothetical protein
MAAQLGIPVAALLALVGARVLLIAQRAGGGAPDRLVGGFFLCMGLGGVPALLANDPSIVPAHLSQPAMACGHALLSMGFTCMALFAWRCFGAESAWRRSAALTVPVLLLICWVAQGFIERFEPPGGAFVRTAALIRMTAVAWAFGETLRYYALMRRRLAIGLGDPVVANRFLLWSLWTGAMLGTILVAIAVRFLLPEFGPDLPATQRAPIVGVFLLLLSTAGVALSLSFFPPRWYADRLRARPAQP